MMFFSHKIKFKKQSQSLGLNLNDKHIKKSKGQLIQLTKKHHQVDESLKKKKIQFEVQKNKLVSQHQVLLKQEKRHRQKILKLQVRKDQLRAKQDPLLFHEKARILKKYLKSMTYTMGDKYQIIRSMVNFSTYDFIKTKILNLELRLHTKSQMKQVVFMKKLFFQDQTIMLMVKQKDGLQCKKSVRSIQSCSFKSGIANSITHPSKFNPLSDGQLTIKKNFEVRIFAITGKAFQLVKVYSQAQLTKFIERLSGQDRSGHLDTFTRLNKTKKQAQRKPRVSLQFNSVFKKSLQVFFFKNTIHTSSQLQDKLVNIDSFIRSSSNSKCQIGSESLKVSQKKSIRQSSQQRSDECETVRSKVQHNEQGRYVTHSNQPAQNGKQEDSQSGTKQGVQRIAVNTKGKCSSQSDILENDSNLFQADSQQSMKNESNNQYRSSFNQQSQISNNNSSKIDQISCPSTGFVRSFIYGQRTLLPNHNHLLNIVILKAKRMFYFLPQYLEDEGNYNKMNLCVRKYQLKIKLQKKVRTSLLYKIVKFDRFFQTQNEVIAPFSLELLFSVKYAKNDLYVPKLDEIQDNMKNGKQTKTYVYLKDGRNNLFCPLNRGFNQQDIIITCENIKCQRQDRRFFIYKILKQEAVNDVNNKVSNMMSNLNTANNRIKGRGQLGQLRKRPNIQEQQKQTQKLKSDRRRKKKKTQRNEDNNIKEQKQYEDIKEFQFREQIRFMFQEFMQNHWLSIKDFKFIKKIDFQKHMDKITMIQKNIKCFYYKKLYRHRKRCPIVCKFQSTSKILITAILDPSEQMVKIFSQCLVVRLNQKYRNHPLVYPGRYWPTISTALSNLMRLSDSVVEVKDQLQKYIQKKIKAYEQQQARLEALKPQLYLNRLRRFFINIMLRVRAKRNILFIKKLYHNSQAYVLIIRKNQILNNVCQANIYHLQQYILKQQNKQKLKEHVNSEQDLIHITLKTINRQQRQGRNNSRYQTISLLTNYFNSVPKQAVANEFYFDNQHFLLKPPRSPSIYYIERLLMVDINSQEISKEITMIQWLQPSKKQKNLINCSFFNLQVPDQGPARLAPSETNNRQMSGRTGQDQTRAMKLETKNPSIQIEDLGKQPEKKLVIWQDKIVKQRSSFRISIRNNCMIPGQEMAKKNINNYKYNNQKNYIKNKQAESKNKLNSVHKLSRNSLYDVYNNSQTNKKAQYQIRGNGHGRIIYYSLAKVEEVFYQLHIYLVKRKFIKIKNLNQNLLKDQIKRAAQGFKKGFRDKPNYQCDQQTTVSQEEQYFKKKAFNDELFLVHRQNLTKKQLLDANWTMLYSKIARWVKSSQSLLFLVESNVKI